MFAVLFLRQFYSFCVCFVCMWLLFLVNLFPLKLLHIQLTYIYKVGTMNVIRILSKIAFRHLTYIQINAYTTYIYVYNMNSTSVTTVAFLLYTMAINRQLSNDLKGKTTLGKSMRWIGWIAHRTRCNEIQAKWEKHSYRKKKKRWTKKRSEKQIKENVWTNWSVNIGHIVIFLSKSFYSNLS